MMFHSKRLKTLFLVAMAAIVGSAVYVVDAAPNPSALEAAKGLVVASGMARSFDTIVPDLLGKLEHNVLATRPELTDSLHPVLLALVPEFVKTEQEVVDGAAARLAARMSEQEVKDALAFFASPSGRRFVEIEPSLSNDIAGLVDVWKQKLSVDMLKRMREEMKKKGVTL